MVVDHRAELAGNIGLRNNLDLRIPLQRRHEFPPVDLVVIAEGDGCGAFHHVFGIDPSDPSLKAFASPQTAGVVRVYLLFITYTYNVLLERGCGGCRRPLTRARSSAALSRICIECANALRPAPPTAIPGLHDVVAVWEYEPAMAQIIQAVKRGGRPDLLRSLAMPLCRKVRPYLQSSTIITWVPASPKGRRRRGFDQGRLLASAVASGLGVKAAPSLTRSGRAQFGSNRTARLEGPRLRIRPDWTHRPVSDQIILIDDVITTGASMAAAAECLGLLQPDATIIGAALAMKP